MKQKSLLQDAVHVGGLYFETFRLFMFPKYLQVDGRATTWSRPLRERFSRKRTVEQRVVETV